MTVAIVGTTILVLIYDIVRVPGTGNVPHASSDSVTILQTLLVFHITLILHSEVITAA